MTSTPLEKGNSPKSRPPLWWYIVAGAVLMTLVGMLWPRAKKGSPADAHSSAAVAARAGSDTVGRLPLALRRFGAAGPQQPAKTAEEIVAGMMRHFGQSRRAIAERIAKRLDQDLPPEIDAFFKAVDKGDWDEIKRRREELFAHQKNHDRPDLEPYWPAVLDTYGVAEQTHDWPAQKLLDYGNRILDSLRPGMVYVGGTDCGRFVPELMNETSGDPHMVITQNALAASTYLDFLGELYGEQFNGLSPEDSQRAFADYNADAQKRLQHDLDFPDEPKQVLPGENIQMVDGKLQFSGETSVMAVNERLLQMMIEKNPELSFATEESIPMRGTYADALPLGPLMELNAQSDQNSFTADRAGQSVDYWRSATQMLLADPEAVGSTYALNAYSHDINATANLLAAHNFTTEAEQMYELASQVWPASPYAVSGLAQVLAQTGHADQARAVLDQFASKYPEQAATIDKARAAILR
jgi:hypothetical protein